MAAKKKTLYRKNDALDVIDITKSAFEVFIVFVIILFLIAVSCTFFFRLITVELPDGDDSVTYSFVTKRNTNGISKGDIVSIDEGLYVSAGEVLAVEGESVSVGGNGISSVIFNGKEYPEGDELSGILDDGKIPEDYVLINRDVRHSLEKITGELIEKKIVTGKAVTVLYPFAYFGREADYIIRK